MMKKSKCWACLLAGVPLILLSGSGCPVSAGMDITSTEGTALRAYGSSGPSNDDGVRGECPGDGVVGESTGTNNLDNGVIGFSAGGYGIYGFTTGADQYGAYFGDPIFVNGGCTGCSTSYVAVNTSTEILEKGDLIKPVGVALAKSGQQQPVMQVSRATSSEDVLGVVVRSLNAVIVEEDDDRDVQPGVHYGPKSGPAQPGDYMVVLVQGMAQIKAPNAPDLAPGNRVYMESGGASVGRALSNVGPDGLMWVLFGLD